MNTRIAILTSCTGSKQYAPPNQLTKKDFLEWDERRISELAEYELPAYQMYTGNQHARLIAGTTHLRSSGNKVDLYILSAGYGLIEGDDLILPYECTFAEMKGAELDKWAFHLNIYKKAAQLFQQTHYDLVLVLLGDDYLRALQLTDDTVFGSPTLFLCANKSEKFIKGTGEFYKVNLSGAEAKRFHCGLVGLKGELARRLLVALCTADALPQAVFDNLLDFLDNPALESNHKISMPKVSISSHPTFSVDTPTKSMKYFMPDWDDTVDAEYDFIGEISQSGSQVYAHQIYERPNYDGLLISRPSVEKRGLKRATLYWHKVHKFLCVPPNFPVMGDCGAFSYIAQPEPPYQTDEMLTYYTDLGFDLGVSIDHLWFGADTKQDQQHRYDLTIHNAEAFLKEHRKRELTWTPIGAIQGWDAPTYTNAAIQLAQMGYDYIGIGGLVRSKTKDIISTVKSIRDAVPSHVRLHVFGVARPDIIHAYQGLNVTSADSASPLRKAFMDVEKGYFTLDSFYTALKIPSVEAYLKQNPQATNTCQLRQSETTALHNIRNLAMGRETVSAALEALLEYENAIRPNGQSMADSYRRTLEVQPWKACPCTICKTLGVEVILFRGRNRNQRRGYHNTYIWNKLMQQSLDGTPVSKEWLGVQQLSLI
jgi:hypothetical protein